ncbi:MAG: hypothetical protein AAFY98_04195 [Verrucomicrobiota bacterium]
MPNASARDTTTLLTEVTQMGWEYADWSMWHHGFINPGLVGKRANDYFTFLPTGILSSQDRAMFDMATKLVCINYQAVSAAIVIEMKVPSQKGIYRPDAAILTETSTNKSRLFIRAVIDEQDQFQHLEEVKSDFQINSGRYSGFIPSGSSTVKIRQETEEMIERMGLEVQIHPTNPFS